MPILNLPVDCNFTVATTAYADLFANRATNSASGGAGGNGALKAITDAGFTLADFGIVLPGAVPLYVTRYNLEVDAICTVQLGLLKSDASVFAPIDTHVCTQVAAGGIVSGVEGEGYSVPMHKTSPYIPRFALKVSSYGGATTVRVTGSLDIFVTPG